MTILLLGRAKEGKFKKFKTTFGFSFLFIKIFFVYCQLWNILLHVDVASICVLQVKLDKYAS